ncbi:MAG: lysylphosphatidylglycerol synthase transmembrane domain-containing protein [Saprospiraceae bacterium]
MKQSKEEKQFTEEQKGVLDSIRISRIILPILIGVGVVAYLFWEQFDAEDFAQIEWSSHVVFWVLLSISFLILRHIAYATRLRILSDKAFSWRKCVELIFIWEFSSAVSPTSVGGSAVALFVLAQEKLSAAKTATIVIYSAVLDTMFFVGTLLALYLVFGWGMIRPESTDGTIASGLEVAFMGAYLFMLIYGSIFFYGLFVNPNSFKWALDKATNIKWLKSYKSKAVELGNDMVIASKEMKRKKWTFHVGSFLSTAGAWSSRFILLACLIIAFKPGLVQGLLEHFKLYARLESVFVIMAASPTPGAAGVAEFTFSTLVKDYIPETGLALLIASGWRLMTYYLYLFAGAVVIPNWVRKLINERKKRKEVS